MKEIFKEFLFVFTIVVFVNIILDLGEEEFRFFAKPVKFFGLAILLSVIGGSIVHWIKNRESRKKND